MTEEFERELYVIRCMKLEQMIHQVIESFSDREIVAVLTLAIFKIASTQEDPKAAWEKIIIKLKELGEEYEI